MSYSLVSRGTLVGLALFSLATFALAERSQQPAHEESYQLKMRAVETMVRAEKAILKAKQLRGLPLDPTNDTGMSGLIGPEFTLTTTDRGAHTAKVLATNPNFAAAVVDMLRRSKLKPGEVVVVGVTGSLPGLNVAVYSACHVMGLKPLVITSVGASMFGATDPEMTWLDMEKILSDEGIIPIRSVAASVGGGADNGRGLSPSGRQLLHDAISRNGAILVEEPTLQENIRRRVAIYDSLAGPGGIRGYINVGGGLASLGGARNGHLIPPGFSHRLPMKNFPNRGVINILGERNIPVIHMLQVERLAKTYGISTDPEAPSKPGKGPLFSKMKYNVPVVAGLSLILLLGQTITLRSDLKSMLLGSIAPNGKGVESR